MRFDEKVQVHFINDEDDKMLLKRVVYHVPSVGEEIRLGGEGREKYYTVVRIVWVYDEPECPFGRANIGVRFAK